MSHLFIEFVKILPQKNMINGVQVSAIVHKGLKHKKTRLNFTITILVNKINENTQYFVVL